MQESVDDTGPRHGSGLPVVALETPHSSRTSANLGHMCVYVIFCSVDKDRSTILEISLWSRPRL